MSRYLVIFGLLGFLGHSVCAEEALRHWAWQPMATSFEHASIDGFLNAKLAEKQLAMSPEADRRTLIRRLSFDLHGLPPAPEAVNAFVEDADPRAYENLVDRVLASPHYGERYARHWLDIAHYADTHGFERDRRRPHAWRYRDYVIDAFNADKSYGRFLQEQIAGDVLWPEDEAAIIATGFLAAGPWDFVGQVETPSPELRRSARSLDLDDMATQVMTATMAVTVNCARCHDHKLDPISQEEYYRLRAVFAGVKRGDRDLVSGRKEKLEAERADLVKVIGKLEPGLSLADMVGGGDGNGSGRLNQGIDPRSGKVESKPMGYLGNVVPNRFSPVVHRFVDGVFIPGSDGETPVSSSGLTVSGIVGADGKAWDLIRNGPVNSTHSTKLGGLDFGSETALLGIHANAGITFDLAAFREALGADLRFTAELGYFGKEEDQFKADVYVLLDGEPVVTFKGLKRADGLKPIDLPIPARAQFLTLMSTAGGNGISHDQVGFGNPRMLGLDSALTEDAKQRLANSKETLKTLNRQITARSGGKVFAVVPEKGMPEVRRLVRGDSESPVGDPLPPGAFAMFAMLDPDLGSSDSSERERRAALATWITDPKNPLAPRVIVNRLWHWHFGQGIVNTPSDFGSGGGAPSHPELLDWLATELIRNGGSLKAVHRLILNSAAYRQQSLFSDDAPGLVVDTSNRLLWRQNPRRIEAEAVRDAVLFVSGKLNLKRGGPGFEDFKYQDTYAPIYTYITADKPELCRRTIYRYIVRTTPDRFMTALDCPDPANFTPKRQTTTTPIQSLALYNNDFMLRQAKHFAERVGGDEQVEKAFWLAFGRGPTAEEVGLSLTFVEANGLAAFCRSLLNANEFVYVD